MERPRGRPLDGHEVELGLDAARRLAGELRADHPDAAASLLEGLEDMFTVRRLGVGGRLALTLTNTNRIESMISVAPTAMAASSDGRTAR